MMNRYSLKYWDQQGHVRYTQITASDVKGAENTFHEKYPGCSIDEIVEIPADSPE